MNVCHNINKEFATKTHEMKGKDKEQTERPYSLIVFSTNTRFLQVLLLTLVIHGGCR